uniref:Small ribosomal subunit protein mS33 n=1 Tax=Podarcis muralis TaxID=64176 RepID=A0A670HKK2_PODMU
KGAGIQLPSHVASMTKPLLANQSSARKCRLPSCRSGTYLSTFTLTCFRTARLAGAGTEQRELTPSRGFEPLTFRLMARLSVWIFGEVARPPPYAMRKEVNAGYQIQTLLLLLLMTKFGFYGLYRDEHEYFKDEMKRLKKLRGKGRPRKEKEREKKERKKERIH